MPQTFLELLQETLKQDKNYKIVGLPFYNTQQENSFVEELKQITG
jgi:hypothetical protein